MLSDTIFEANDILDRGLKHYSSKQFDYNKGLLDKVKALNEELRQIRQYLDNPFVDELPEALQGVMTLKKGE